MWLNELWVKAGVGDSTRFIPLHTLAIRLWQDLCQVLPAVHALTGCDFTSKVGTKHAALTAQQERYLKQFGKICDAMEVEKATSEEYLMHVLKKCTSCRTPDQLGAKTYRPIKNLSLDELQATSKAYVPSMQHIRWFPFHHKTHKSSILGTTVLKSLTLEVRENAIPEEITIFCSCGKCANVRCNAEAENYHVVNSVITKIP